MVAVQSPSLSIAVVGVGYVGLPLCLAFSKWFDTRGYDTDSRRIQELIKGCDRNGELDDGEDIFAGRQLSFTDDLSVIADCNVYIVTVPTPVSDDKTPDLRFLKQASQQIGSLLVKGDTVIFESTVYPGATEEECVPLLESASGLTLNRDFWVGYSPERVSPGKQGKPMEEVIKVVSASDEPATEFVDRLYQKIIPAGTYRAPSIRVAEAAKVIENTQRDINIALMNEFALIFNKIGLDTQDVLAAASTKWNFLDFKPGLVGGHCICVDPYYLTHQAYSVGVHPDILLDARKLNDQMPGFVAQEIARLLQERGIGVASARILILGVTFKENCADLRNSGVKGLAEALCRQGASLTLVDPLCHGQAAGDYLGLPVCSSLEVCLDGGKGYDGVVLATPHRLFCEMTEQQITSLVREGGVIYDIKGAWPRHLVSGRL